ncbi:hypothetical protein [Sulfurimonas sp.]|uniref:hypothetical protein n=1 Tax=Sulfurimonas sp. TaxID=2022749 RepID=UPI002AB30BE9|nr:hypothetical protein [Sulfurimonas sp.]
MYKNLIILMFSVSLLVGSLSSSEVNSDEGVAEYNNLRVYGLGLKVGTPNSDENNKNYNGAGLEFENNFSKLTLEYGSDYTLGSAVLKGDITKDFYIKGGLGYLQRGMLIEDSDADVTQTTGGGSLGYGDDKSYNIEAGYIISQLKNASSADGDTKISYLELIAKHTFAKYATFDIVGIYQNSNVFDKNYADYKAELGWFATDDVRAYLAHDSVNHSKNDYAVRAGLQYTFATSKFSPYLKASLNPDTNIGVGVEYSQGITNKSLKMRDLFENAIGSSSIVAQAVAPKVFATKVVKPKPIVISAPAVNHAPTGRSFHLSFKEGIMGTINLTSMINDPDGDNMTINIGRINNRFKIPIYSLTISGNIISLEVGISHGPMLIDLYYTVSDGTATSPEYWINISLY